jgi:hypothetical protein
MATDDPIAGYDELEYKDPPYLGTAPFKIQRGCIGRVRGNDCYHFVIYKDGTYARLTYDEIGELQKTWGFLWVHRDPLNR